MKASTLAGALGTVEASTLSEAQGVQEVEEDPDGSAEQDPDGSGDSQEGGVLEMVVRISLLIFLISRRCEYTDL